MFFENVWAIKISKPLFTKCRTGHASSHKSPLAKPWYAASKNGNNFLSWKPQIQILLKDITEECLITAWTCKISVEATCLQTSTILACHHHEQTFMVDYVIKRLLLWNTKWSWSLHRCFDRPTFRRLFGRKRNANVKGGSFPFVLLVYPVAPDEDVTTESQRYNRYTTWAEN